MSGIHELGDVFIAGIGWVDPDSVKCVKCGDRGMIVTAFEDRGNAETGPLPPVASDGYFCDCEEGVKAAIADADWTVGLVMSNLSSDRTQAIEFLMNEGFISTLADGSLWAGWTESSDEDFKANVERFVRTKVSGDDLEKRHAADDQRVHRVWWGVQSNCAMAYDDALEQTGDESAGYIDGRYDQHRLKFVLDRIGELARAQWPNATDWDIVDTGFEGNWARFSPRVEFENGESLDWGMDTLQGFEEKAIQEAWERWTEDTDATSIKLHVKPDFHGRDHWDLMVIGSHLDDMRKHVAEYIAKGFHTVRLTDDARPDWEEFEHEPERPLMSYTHGSPHAITRAINNLLKPGYGTTEGKYPVEYSQYDLHTVLAALCEFGQGGDTELRENASSLYSGILQTLGVETI